VPALTLEPIGRFPGLRVLAWDDQVLYASRGWTLVRWDPGHPAWEAVAAFDPGVARRLAGRSRLGDRLLRGGCHALARVGGGSLVAVFPKTIAVLPPRARQLRAAFRIPRGTRPLSLTAAPTGWAYFGEYFDNPARASVHIYGSADGTAWRPVYTFPAGAIRHVHSVTYDRYAECVWVLTGDDGDECRIVRASLDWSSVDVVLTGSQQARAVTVVPREDGLYFATDTPFEQNYVYRLDRSGRAARLAPIAASSFWSCRVGSALFVSTAVEPSAVNTGRDAILYGSGDGAAWTALLRWTRDAWPPRLFQYANIILPAGCNDGDVLAATGFAVRGEDHVTHLWRVRRGG
jgi:hypothetical protein